MRYDCDDDDYDEPPSFWQRVTPPILYDWIESTVGRVRDAIEIRRIRRECRNDRPLSLPPIHHNCRCVLLEFNGDDDDDERVKP